MERIPTDIGNILLRMGALSPEELKEAVAEHVEEKQRLNGSAQKLGELLVNRGTIKTEILDKALTIQDMARSEDPKKQTRGLMFLLHSAVDTFEDSSKSMGSTAEATLRKLG